MKLEEKVDEIIKQEAVVLNVKGIKSAEKDFSSAHTKIRTMIRQIPDKPKARQLEKQLDRVMSQMLELFGSLYFKG